MQIWLIDWLISVWVQDLAALMHLGLNDGPFVPHNESWEPRNFTEVPDGPQACRYDTVVLLCIHCTIQWIFTVSYDIFHLYQWYAEVLRMCWVHPNWDCWLHSEGEGEDEGAKSVE